MDNAFLKYPEPKKVWLLTGDRDYYRIRFSGIRHIKDLELRFGSPLELIQHFFEPDSVRVFEDEISARVRDEEFKIIRNRPYEVLNSFSTMNPTLLSNHPLILAYINCYFLLKTDRSLDDIRFLGSPVFEMKLQKWQIIEQIDNL